MSVVAPEANVLELCTKVVRHLADEYQWFVPSADELSRAVASRISMETAEPKLKKPDAKAVERHCCIAHFADLYDALADPASDGHEGAQRELFEPVWSEENTSLAVTYRGYLFRVAMRMAKSKGLTRMPKLATAELEQLAADAATAALTSIRQNIASCRDRELFWGWATRIVENALRDQLRQLRPEEVGPDVELVGGEEAEEKVADAVSVREEFARKCRIGKLSSDQRATVFRFFWHEQTVPEIAAELSRMKGAEVTAAAVSVWKSRALRTLGENLKERGFR
ncbi:MAG: sigma-70 family RNA polymerase sigma factor [Chloroflexota bacterium]|nr:sigma-70 family RNA polymerase sigma factor [Chloroflexota bacterium]